MRTPTSSSSPISPRRYDAVLAEQRRSLIVGECWDVGVDEEIAEDDFAVDSSWERTPPSARLNRSVSPGGPDAIDFFVFRKGTIGPLPDFTVGRPGWDNWMIWYARSVGMPVVDISPSTLRRAPVARVFARSESARFEVGGTGRRCESGAPRLQTDPIHSRVRDASAGGLEAPPESDRRNRPPSTRVVCFCTRGWFRYIGCFVLATASLSVSRRARALPPAG